MSDGTNEVADARPKRSKLPLLVGLVLALAGGAGGFYAAWTGLIPLGTGASTAVAQKDEPDALPDIAFVELSPIIVSLGTPANQSHLRFRAQLEVPASYQSDVETLIPRVVDVLNSYLRALEMSDFVAPGALARLRAQMLRRIQIVLGRERVNDLLVMEFVIN